MKKVVIGISGGVDSSVAAVLLKEQGYEVIGVTFVFTDDFDVKDAIEVCKKLSIEHHIIDYKKEFKEIIIDKFISDYKAGLTPNPCVLCNKKVKLKLLYDKMLEYNADAIATGHYAKIKNNKLYLSKDLNKDQTYFLCEVSNEILSKLLLPLDGLEKSYVRDLAKKYDLITASKKDSTDVCFINNKFKNFFNKENTLKGDIINIENNQKIGTHNGLALYTIGQRKGLNLGGNGSRTFTVGKDLKNNILYVATGAENDYLFSDAALIDTINWISDNKPLECTAKFRYRQPNNKVYMKYLNDGNILVSYPQKVKSVTPGQACVFYLEEECLGGGIIREVYRNNEKITFL